MTSSDKDPEIVPGSETQIDEIKTVEEKPKAPAPKPPISRSGPTFPQGNQFRWGQGNNRNSTQPPRRAIGRGR